MSAHKMPKGWSARWKKCPICGYPGKPPCESCEEFNEAARGDTPPAEDELLRESLEQMRRGELVDITPPSEDVAVYPEEEPKIQRWFPSFWGVSPPARSSEDADA